MADINLLPEELRKKQEEERLKKKPKVIEIELVRPAREAAPQKKERVPRPSLLAMLFGTPEERLRKQQEQEARRKAEVDRRVAAEGARKQAIEERKRLLIAQKTLEAERQKEELRKREEEVRKTAEAAAEKERQKTEVKVRQAEAIRADKERREMEERVRKETQTREAEERAARERTQKEAEERKVVKEVVPEELPAEMEAAKISLLPGKAAPLTPKPPKLLPYLVPLVVSLMIVLLASGAMFLVQRNLNTVVVALSLRAQTLNMEVNEQELALEEAFLLQKQMTAAVKLLRDHRYLTNVLLFLEQHTLPDTSYQTLTFSDGKISLSVNSPNFSKAAEQLLVFLQTKEFLDPSFNRFAREKTEAGEKVRFDIQFTLSSDVMRK